MSKFFSIIAMCIFCTVGSVGFTAEPKDALQELKTILESRHYIITIDNIFGTKGLLGLYDDRFLVVKGDSAFADLPYIGKIENPNLTMMYSTDVEFEKLYTDYKMEEIQNGKKFTTSFEIKIIGEIYNIKITIDKKFYATIIVKSTARNPVVYSGKLEAIAKNYQWEGKTYSRFTPLIPKY